MAQNISVPDIGDFKDVEVIEVLVKPGDQINKNDPIVTIESDKSSLKGITAQEIKANVIVTIGARINIILLALAGMIISLKIYFKASAND